MEQSSTLLQQLILWGLGICFTGFLFTLKRLYDCQKEVEDKMTKFECKMETEIKKDINEVVSVLKEIKDALVGNFEKKGIITRTFEVEKRIEHIENDIHAIKHKVGV